MSVTAGAGFNGAGLDMGAGADLLTFSVPAPPPVMPAAVNYDASQKLLTENADGTFLTVHPVDQIVQIRLTIPDGAVAAMRGVCARYGKRLTGVPAQQKQSIALDETR